MKTSHPKERLLALCALIAEEKDSGKFLLLVHELKNAFEESGVENIASTATLHSGIGNGSPRA